MGIGLLIGRGFPFPHSLGACHRAERLPSSFSVSPTKARGASKGNVRGHLMHLGGGVPRFLTATNDNEEMAPHTADKTSLYCNTYL